MCAGVCMCASVCRCVGVCRCVLVCAGVCRCGGVCVYVCMKFWDNQNISCYQTDLLNDPSI